MQVIKKLPEIVVLGDNFQCGSYILRIQLKEAVNLRFGRFKKGKLIHLPVGEYAYVGSAFSSLASRLVRHATRSGNQPPHRIRAEMIECFKRIGLGKQNPLPKRAKKKHWHIDYLVDLQTAEIVNVLLIRSDRKLESTLGKLLENDAHTHVFEKGLGASDLPGHTHILRVVADEMWWCALADRLGMFL
ncbi:GIY-YIG nuclease family protein [Candidatus Poribacteria bacterium]|nr:GIY-YIG nuclease family protein [Candidatus Poribacteria bacterium]